MPGPLDAEFAAALIAHGLPPAQVLDAARCAALESSTLLGWLAQQRQLEPARLEQVLTSIPPVPCPACQQPLPLSDLWPRVDAGCPRCGAALSTAGVEARIGAVCHGQTDPGRPAAQPGLNDTVPAPGAPAAGTGLSVGQTFHGFELLQELGRGGMGVVFRARQATPRREVALKILFTRGTPETLRARFRREIDTLASLSGEPGIVNIFEAGEDRGLLYFAMELVPGGSLADLVRRAPIDPAQALQLAADTARALHVAHEAGIVHRDVKPANVLLTASGRPKVGDFGLVLSATDERVTRSGDVIGTPLYLAPEQLDTHDVDRRCDVYALGVVLYQLLTGQHPHPQASGTAQIYTAILSKPHVTLLKAAPDLPPAIERVTERALHKAPERRYPTALAFAEELDRCRLELSAGDGDAPGSSATTLGLAAVAVVLTVLLIGLYTQRERFGGEPQPPQASAPPAPSDLAPPPTPTPTPVETPTPTQVETPTPTPAQVADPQVVRLLERVGAFRAAAVRNLTKQVQAAFVAAQRERQAVAQRRPDLRRHPAIWILAAWVGRYTPDVGGHSAAAQAVRASAGTPYLSLAREIWVMTADTQRHPKRSGKVVAAVEALLSEDSEFAPLPDFFNVANDAGSRFFNLVGGAAFWRPSGLLVRKPKEPQRAAAYFTQLVTRNIRDLRGNRSWAYMSLACIQLGAGDRAAVTQTLDRMNERANGYFLGHLLRAGYRLHTQGVEAARPDLTRCRAWFTRYRAYPTLEAKLAALEQRAGR